MHWHKPQQRVWHSLSLINSAAHMVCLWAIQNSLSSKYSNHYRSNSASVVTIPAVLPDVYYRLHGTTTTLYPLPRYHHMFITVPSLWNYPLPQYSLPLLLILYSLPLPFYSLFLYQAHCNNTVCLCVCACVCNDTNSSYQTTHTTYHYIKIRQMLKKLKIIAADNWQATDE